MSKANLRLLLDSSSGLIAIASQDTIIGYAERPDWLASASAPSAAPGAYLEAGIPPQPEVIPPARLGYLRAVADQQAQDAAELPPMDRPAPPASSIPRPIPAEPNMEQAAKERPGRRVRGRAECLASRQACLRAAGANEGPWMTARNIAEKALEGVKPWPGQMQIVMHDVYALAALGLLEKSSAPGSMADCFKKADNHAAITEYLGRQGKGAHPSRGILGAPKAIKGIDY
jgi:hypothetical protein